MILGITGGIGCGKSTAARACAARGFALIDTDALIREQVLTAPPVVEALRHRFGGDVVGAGGTVNRAALASRVFADDKESEAELHWLEALTHPVLFGLWRKLLAGDPGGRWVVEVPLLFEQGLENWFDFTVCVACSPAQQLARLEQRGLPRSLAGQRISKQLPLARKIELADMVLWNDGSPAFLQVQVDQLVASLSATR